MPRRAHPAMMSGSFHCARTVAVLIDGEVAYSGPTDHLFADPDLLLRAHLALPPLLVVRRRLAALNGRFPPAATTDAFASALEDCARQAEPAPVALLGGVERAAERLPAGEERR